MKSLLAVMLAATLGCGGGPGGPPARKSAAETLATLEPTSGDEPAGPAGSPRDQVHTLFLRGEQQFEEGRYRRAEESFMAAYEIGRAPALLFNAAVCREKLGDRMAAAALYRRYLEESPDARDRAVVEKHVRELESSPPLAP